MDNETCAAYKAWKRADQDSIEADAALRLAFVKHFEGITGPPADDLLSQACMAHYETQLRLLDTLELLRLDSVTLH